MSFISMLESLPDDIKNLSNQLSQALDFPDQLGQLLSPLINAESWIGDAAASFAGGIGSSISSDVQSAISIIQGFINAIMGAIQVILEVIGVIGQIIDGVVSVVEDIGNAIASVY